MPTVRDIVTDAMSALGEQTTDDSDLQVGVGVLRRMLGTWANEGMTVYTTTEGTITLVAGTATYSTTTLSTGRPVAVQSMFLRLDGIDYPVEPVNETEFDGIAYKSAQGLPTVFCYEPSYPNGSFSFYPIPSAAYVAHVKGNYPLISGTLDLTTSVSLPHGYEAAIVDNLAVKLAPHFGIEASPTIRLDAANGKRALAVTNHVPLRMTSSLDRSSMPGYIRILGDT